MVFSWRKLIGDTIYILNYTLATSSYNCFQFNSEQKLLKDNKIY